jgi:hypothetical protein
MLNSTKKTLPLSKNLLENCMLRDIFLLLLFFLAAIYIFDGLGIHPDVVRRGADMNYTFNFFGHEEPQKLAEEARKWGTFLTLTDKATGKPMPRETGAIEVGYYIIIQLFGILGLKMNEFVLAKLHVFVFLLNSFIFALALGIANKKIFPLSFIVLSFLFFFRYHNEPLIYHVVGVWTFTTSIVLLTMTALLAIRECCFLPSNRNVLVLIIVGVFGGLIGMLRESESYVYIFSCIAFLILNYILYKIPDFKKLIVIVLIILFSYSITLPLLKKGILYHRAYKTDLMPKEYGSGFSHGAWHVLVVSLGRYENPYGYYYSDYFAIDTADKIYVDKNIKERGWFTASYMKVLKQYYFDQVFKHPGYYMCYLFKSTLDYAMFIPYSLFLDRPSRSPIGAHVPVINHNVKYNPQDYVWHDRMLPNGDVPKDTTALKNLKPKYFYLNKLEWSLFSISLFVVIIAPFLIKRNCPQNIFIFVIGMYIVFFFQSFLRILIPMHGWGAVLTYCTIFSVNTALLLEVYLEKISGSGSQQLKFRKYAVVIFITVIFILISIRSFGVHLVNAHTNILGDMYSVANSPKLLEENFLGYNIVLFNDRYYGFPLGFLPDYSDPNLAERTEVFVADSTEQIKQLIREKR